MAVQALLVIVAGFVFIFAPGVPMGLLGRRVPGLNRELMYWGMGLWLAALVLGLFVQSVLRLLVLPGAGPAPGSVSAPPPGTAVLLAVLGALVTSGILQSAMYWLLKRRRVRPAQVFVDGLPLGFGVGLLPQIFNGIGLVSAGVGLLLSGTATGPLANIASVGLPELLLVLLSLIMFRPALLVVSAVCGVLAARAVTGERRLLLAAIVVDAVFAAGALLIQTALAGTGSTSVVMGVPGALAAVVLLVYYGLTFALAYGWLVGRLENRRRTAEDRRRTTDDRRRTTDL